MGQKERDGWQGKAAAASVPKSLRKHKEHALDDAQTYLEETDAREPDDVRNVIARLRQKLLVKEREERASYLIYRRIKRECDEIRQLLGFSRPMLETVPGARRRLGWRARGIYEILLAQSRPMSLRELHDGVIERYGAKSSGRQMVTLNILARNNDIFMRLEGKMFALRMWKQPESAPRVEQDDPDDEGAAGEPGREPGGVDADPQGEQDDGGEHGGGRAEPDEQDPVRGLPLDQREE
jgi:hypothetical protein